MDVTPNPSRDSGLHFSNRSKFEAPRQSHCWDVCQISERYDHYNIHSRDSMRFGGKSPYRLTHWGRVTHICSKLSSYPDRRQAIIWTNAGILFIGTLGTNSNEILIEIHTFSFKNIHLKMSPGKWRPFCLGLKLLMNRGPDDCCWEQYCGNLLSLLSDYMTHWRIKIKKKY